MRKISLSLTAFLFMTTLAIAAPTKTVLLNCGPYPLIYRGSKMLNIYDHEISVPDMSIGYSRVGVFPNSEGVIYRSERGMMLRYLLADLDKVKSGFEDYLLVTINNDKREELRDLEKIKATIKGFSKTDNEETPPFELSDTWAAPRLIFNLDKSENTWIEITCHTL